MINHLPRRLRPGRCRCGISYLECLIQRGLTAPLGKQWEYGQQIAREMQRERGRWWARGAR